MCLKKMHAGEDERNRLTQVQQDATQKVSEYLQEQVLGSTEDMQLLHSLNTATRERVGQMSLLVQRLIQQTSAMASCTNALFQPYVDQCAELSARVGYLEQVTDELDAYTLKLDKHSQQQQSSSTHQITQ